MLVTIRQLWGPRFGWIYLHLFICQTPSHGVTVKVYANHCNSLLTPDVSKSPESIKPEEPVLELRQSVTIEREVKVPVEVQGPAFPIKVDALLDSGATGCFIDKSWALERQIELKPLKNPIPVLNIDGTRNQAGDITHFVSIIIKIGRHAEKLWCAVTCLGKTPLILNDVWLSA